MTSDVKTVAIDRTFATLSKVAPWVLAAFVLFFVALPFLPNGGHPRNPAGVIVLSLFGVCFFGFLAWAGFRIAKRLPYCTVSIDKDGLWPAHASKATALVRWDQVHSTKEHPYLQRLDVMDASGMVLIKLEYQLSQFDSIRALLLEKVPRPVRSMAPVTYAKTIIYHACYVVGLTGFSLLGWYVGMSNPLLGYGGMAILVGLILYEYLTSVSRVVILPDRLQIGYPLRAREFPRARVEAARIGDFYNQGVRHPEVGLFIHGEKKPIRLRGLGTDALNLQQTLHQWRKDGY